MNTPNIYQMVTDRIIASLKKGCVPWKQPWTSNLVPRNLITLHAYRGANIWMLASLGFTSPYYLSFRQVNNLGGNIKKGEKSCPVVFWKKLENTKAVEDEPKQIWLLRYYNVFNLEQCENIPERFLPVTETRTNFSLEACTTLIEHMPFKPAFATADHAYYDPHIDTVYVPPMHTFIDSESYYGTLFHELVHSTGHIGRLNREGITQPITFGSPTYSLEELIAEMGACFLASSANIADLHFDNSASYIQSWLKALENDQKLVVKASSQAQLAVDYILNTGPIHSTLLPSVDAVHT